MTLQQVEDLRSLFLNNTPLLDVRAPVEFSQGAFPQAVNLPLINDKERTDIGLRYKTAGQDEAIRLGHKLVSGKIRSERILQWQAFIEKYPDGVLYCFRGGMRSKISQQWIHEETGIDYPRVKGGYKAMRRFLIDELEHSSESLNPVILGGRTGSGKTLFLKEIKQQLDLEGIFHHRGSVFGKHVTAQPSQIDIENRLSIELLKLRQQQTAGIVLEDEGINIGSRNIPEALFRKMKQSPLILLETSVEQRIEITFQEYIIEALDEHLQHYGKDSGFSMWAEQLQTAVDKIQRRLGGLRHKQLRGLLDSAIDLHRNQGDSQAHKKWIEMLLVDYYDPMYDFQLSKKDNRVVFKGNRQAVLDYLESQYQIS